MSINSVLRSKNTDPYSQLSKIIRYFPPLEPCLRRLCKELGLLSVPGMADLRIQYRRTFGVQHASDISHVHRIRFAVVGRQKVRLAGADDHRPRFPRVRPTVVV